MLGIIGFMILESGAYNSGLGHTRTVMQDYLMFGLDLCMIAYDLDFSTMIMTMITNTTRVSLKSHFFT